jgi:CHAD domain-containing protein
LQNHNPQLRKPVAKLAGKLLRQNYRRLVRAGRLDARRHIVELHAIRISGKKLRYALEFFTDIGTVHPFAPALPGLKSLQKHLGNANDAATALALIAHERPGAVSPQARRKIESWAAARIPRCIASAQPGMRLIKRVFSR